MWINPVARGSLASGCVLAALLGCGSGPSQPDPGPTSYTLQTLNESALPYDHEGLGCCTYLSGGLQLGQGGYAVSLTARNRNTGATFTAIEWGKYSLQLAALTFARDSFALQPFLLDVGIPSGSEIRVSFGGEGPGSPDQFRALFVRVP